MTDRKEPNSSPKRIFASTFVNAALASALCASLSPAALADCAGILRPASPEPIFEETFARSVFQPEHELKAEALLQTRDLRHASRNTPSSTSINALRLASDRLSQVGLKNKEQFFNYNGEERVGLQLLIDANPQEPLYRMLTRLRSLWKKAGAKTDFPEIILLSSGELEKMHAKGAYLDKKNWILISMESLSQYFSSGWIPLTLQHELRHASFNAFKDRHLRSDQAFFLATFSAQKPVLRTKWDGYRQFLSLEELQTFFLQSHHLALMHRSILLKVLGDREITQAKAFGITERMHALREFLSHTISIQNGTHIELETLLKAVSDGSAKIEIPFFSKEIRISRIEEGSAVTFSFQCGSCSDRSSAVQALQKMHAEFKKTYSIRRDAVRSAHDRVSEIAKAMKEAESGKRPYPSRREVLDVLDQSIRELTQARQQTRGI